MAAMSRLPMRLSVMGVAPVPPLRASLAVHGVWRDLVAAGEGVPGIFGPVIVAMHPRPAHKAVATQGIMPFFKTVEAYTNVSSPAVRTWFELGAIHDVLLPPQPFWRPRASIVQDYVQSSGNSHRCRLQACCKSPTAAMRRAPCVACTGRI